MINPTNGTTITGTGEVDATITVTDADNNTIGTAVVDANGQWSITPTTPLANGVVLTATQEDTSGNVSTGSGSVPVDNVAPDAPAINPTNGTTITGTGEVGATITVTDADNNTIGTAVVDANGEWTITPTTPLANGVVLTATQEDTSGNTSISSGGTTVDSTDSDATLTVGDGVSEPVNLPSTADTEGEAINLFDFKLTDGGTGDGFTTDVSQVVIHTSGTADFSKVTWRLNGANVSNITGTYDSNANTLTFSGLNISVTNGTSETYTVSGYYASASDLTDNQTYVLSVNGDDDLTVDEAKTKMSGSNVTINNGTGTKVDIVATKLRFMVLPSN
ncbi:MAG: T1SS secreted agglutinin RTX [uncultured Sulfurovum sp.]|uniref:T1SS secreted agglutinin RTX n=1 Tax=uncultured Sulfurovum sp. TaxID=269237 RepID=A0A6S6SGC2_9BACT|nr:MAG: T1SS secreted agglutinin RTX [uncultured Sulfurovum sp.]